MDGRPLQREHARGGLGKNGEDALRVMVLDDYQDVALPLLAQHGLADHIDIERLQRHVEDHDQLVALLRPFDVIVAMRERTPLPAMLIERLPRLRLIITTGATNAAIDVGAAHRAGILVCGTSSLVFPTVQLTWCLVLALQRHLIDENASVRAGGWQVGLGEGLEDKTLGIIGLGRIGQKVAAIGRAFGMEVIAWSPTLEAKRAKRAEAEAVSREQFFARADIVSVHSRLTPQTARLVGSEELALMSPTSCLINTARSSIVSEQALLQALRNREIAAAGLDVFDVEPLPADHAFRHLPNVLATPHVGYVTRQNYELLFQGVAEDIMAFIDGKPIRVLEPNTT